MAGCVEKGASVIDVGTDHGLIPVWLVQEEVAKKVFATDLRPGPLLHAKELVVDTETEEFITLRVCNGLDGFSAVDTDTVIISGLGGENIAEILSSAPWTKENVRLILQPQSKSDVLRRWLLKNGYAVQSERLVEDAGYLYQILCVRGGDGEPYTEAELHTGRFDQVKNEPMFGPYLEKLRVRAQKAAPYDEDAYELLRQYDEMKERLCHDEGL